MGTRGFLILAVGVILCAGGLAPVSALNGETPPADLQAIENAFVALADRVAPAVVAIETRYDPTETGRGRVPMVGSGVILEPEGLILTNDHVVRGGSHIQVTLQGGKRYPAQLVGEDERSDLAVLRIDARNLPTVQQGDLRNIRVGQFALAMGNPYGTSKEDGQLTLTYGIVSALGKALPSLTEGGRKYYGNLIQTTADIHPGNSGGPLFDIHGRLIGINTAIETRGSNYEGLGYAIPLSDRTKRIISTLAAGLPVQYGFLGVSIVDADDRTRMLYGVDDPWGVVVTKVERQTPAHRAGIRRDDVILEFASEPVRSADHLVRLVGASPVGEQVAVVVQRRDRQLRLTATIAERDDERVARVRE